MNKSVDLKSLAVASWKSARKVPGSLPYHAFIERVEVAQLSEKLFAAVFIGGLVVSDSHSWKSRKVAVQVRFVEGSYVISFRSPMTKVEKIVALTLESALASFEDFIFRLVPSPASTDQSEAKKGE